jgi:ribosomal protein S16
MTFEVNEEKAQLWLSRGARPSETVKQLFDKAGLTK